MPIVFPPPCRPGDAIAVVHAAGRADPDAVAAGVKALEQRGFIVRYDAALGAGSGYLAASDEARAASVIAAIEDPQVRAVVCARGGYGAMRLLPLLPARLLAEHPTWLVGYSDITALHAWAARQGVASLHGPMVASLPKHDDDTLEPLIAALASAPLPLVGAPQAGAHAPVEGPLIGGNLSLLAALVGTPHAPSFDGAILVLEDVGEPLYRIDRMLTTLALAGVPGRIAGLVLGQFTDCGGYSEAAATDAVTKLVADWGVPLLRGVATGHGAANRTWVHAATATLDLARGTVTLRDLATDAPASPDARSAPMPPKLTLGATALGGPTGLIEEALRTGICTAISVEASRAGEVVWRLAAGVTAQTPDAVRAPVTPRTVFDVASVTKAVVTSVLAGCAIERGLVGLDTRIPSALSASGATLRDLLRHTSGLPAHVRVFDAVRDAGGTPEAAQRAAERAFAAIPSTGTPAPVYSDVGYIALGRWLAALLGGSLADAFANEIATPLQLDNARFGDGRTPIAGADGVAATEWCPWRLATLQGIVHDENAQVLGGVAGHAGLFATAGELATIARSLLGHGPQLLAPETVAMLWDTQHRVEGGTYTLGWDTPSGPRSNAGQALRPDSTIGHLGFTGTSLWIERERELVVSLVTNRVHPTRDNAGIRALRPALHDAIVRTLT